MHSVCSLKINFKIILKTRYIVYFVAFLDNLVKQNIQLTMILFMYMLYPWTWPFSFLSLANVGYVTTLNSFFFWRLLDTVMLNVRQSFAIYIQLSIWFLYYLEHRMNFEVCHQIVLNFQIFTWLSVSRGT